MCCNKTTVSDHTFDLYVHLRYDEISHMHWRRQLWGTGARAPLDLKQFDFFSALWPIQSLTATICRQLPPVKKPSNFCMCPSWHQILATPLRTWLRPAKVTDMRSRQNVLAAWTNVTRCCTAYLTSSLGRYSQSRTLMHTLSLEFGGANTSRLCYRRGVSWLTTTHYYQPRTNREGKANVNVRPSVRPFVSTLSFEPIWPLNLSLFVQGSWP